MNSGYIENPILYSSAINTIKHQCKCGHKVVIIAGKTKNLCSLCGHYVYINKFEEFKDRVRKEIKNNK